MEQNAIEPLCFRRLFRNCPWLVFYDVLVHPRNQLPNILEPARKVVVVEIRSMIRYDARGKVTDFRISLRLVWRRNTPGPVFGKHGDGTAQKIPEVVCEVAVRALDDRFECEIAILSEHHFPQQVIPQKL